MLQNCNKCESFNYELKGKHSRWSKKEIDHVPFWKDKDTPKTKQHRTTSNTEMDKDTQDRCYQNSSKGGKKPSRQKASNGSKKVPLCCELTQSNK